MAKGTRNGVSIQQLPSGSWRIRWREWVEEDGVQRRVQRSRVVTEKNTALVVQANVVRALERGELYDDPEPVRVTPTVASIDRVLEGWIRAKASRGIAPNTHLGYIGSIGRILRTLRAMHGIGADVPVPGTLLTRDTVFRLTAQLRADKHAAGTVYMTIRALVEAWVWGGDDPATYPGLVPAPRDTRAMLPRKEASRALPAPTLAEMDAVIRRLAASWRNSNMALPFAVVARGTGLRSGQILSIRVGDVHLAECSLDVTTGKSAAEKVGRTVPIAPWLRDWLAPRVAGRDPGELLLRRRSDTGVLRKGARKGERTTGRPAGPGNTIAAVWDAATAAGEVRREVWAKGETRAQGRPDHAFRAGFQDALEAAGVRDELIDAFVGHKGGSIRRRHYADGSALFPAMAEAIAKLPPIDWQEPAEQADDSNVVRPNFGGK